MHYTATYSPDDNKLRIYGPRFDDETYQRVKAAGYRWAPRQELWVAPAWSPGREDIALELAGEIGDEDTSLVERAEARAERFEDYSDKRGAEANRAREAADQIAERFYGGQPILVGHHSEKRARKDQERIHANMRKAVNLWETAGYWADRAKGAVRAAKYKELPAVRARRIKGLESDLRKTEKTLRNAENMIKAWGSLYTAKTKAGEPADPKAVALYITNREGYSSYCFPLADYPRDPPASQYEGPMGLWSALDGGVITAEQAVELLDIRPGDRCLEPSAGTGMLLGAMGGKMFGHNPERGSVVAIEINPGLANCLKRDFPLTAVICADFLDLTVDPDSLDKVLTVPFDKILMNPPFENGADIKHILHAFGMLKPGGRLVAICANGPRQQAKLMPQVRHWFALPNDTFKDAGTSVRTALIVMEKEPAYA